MRYKDLKQHSKPEPKVTVDRDRYNNITVIVSQGTNSIRECYIAERDIEKTVTKLARRLR